MHARIGRLAAIAATATAIGASLVAPSAFASGPTKPVLTRYALTPPPGVVSGDSFGYGIAVSGSLAVVGANDHKVNGHAAQGEVLLYRRSSHGWTHTLPFATLTDGASTASDAFGASIATDGHTIVVGADGSQKVYVFTEPAAGWKSSSHPTAVLSASNTVAGDTYGLPVAISGSTIAVGAYSHTPTASSSEAGSVYIYNRQGAHWATTSTPSAEIDAAIPSTDGGFGAAIALSGNTLVVGAFNTGLTGLAFVYTKPPGGWADATTPRELHDANPAEGDDFGFSVGLAGSTVFVGAQDRAVSLQPAGAVYIYNKPTAGWGSSADAPLISTTELTESTAKTGDVFGHDLVTYGDQVAIGAPFSTSHGKVDAGDAWLFTRPASGWHSATTASASELNTHPAANQEYGETLASDGHSLLASALEGGKNKTGSADIFVPKPTISSVKQSKTSWKRTTTFSFVLSNPATVSLSFSEKKHGHYKHVGTLTVHAKAGTTKIRFNAKISHGKKLTAGKCEVQIHGTSTYGDTSAKALKFTITG